MSVRILAYEDFNVIAAGAVRHGVVEQGEKHAFGLRLIEANCAAYDERYLSEDEFEADDEDLKEENRQEREQLRQRIESYRYEDPIGEAATDSAAEKAAHSWMYQVEGHFFDRFDDAPPVDDSVARMVQEMVWRIQES